MPQKIYSCKTYPKLVIAGVCEFRDGAFSTESAVIQQRIETSVSFQNGLISLIAEEGFDGRELPSKTAVMRMDKHDLVELGKTFGLDVGSDMLKSDLLEEVLTLYKE